jgi:multiple sugar transport system substrate-binding protein
MKYKKSLSLFVAAAMAATALTGCSSGGASNSTATTQPTESAAAPAATSDAATPAEATQAAATDDTSATAASTDMQPAKLRMWAHWGSEQRRPTIDKMIQMFNDKYADNGVSAEYVYVPFDSIETKYVASVTAGSPPDVVISAIEAVNTKAMRNQAEDITDYVSPDTQGKFYDKYWQAALYNDRVYALPFNTDTRFIFYNKSMFSQAGVDASTIKTWDDLTAAADKLDATFKGQGNYKAAFLPMIGNFGYSSVAISDGAHTWDDDMNPDVCTLDSPANIESLNYMKTWCDRYGKDLVQSMEAQSGSGANDYFISGQVAMIGNVCNYIATLEQYDKDDSGNWIVDYDTFTMPTGPSWTEGDPRAAGGGFVATVGYGTKNPLDATRLAEYMTCGDAANVWAVEQKDVMCCEAANEQPELAGATGWDRVLELLPLTQTSRRNVYDPDASTSEDKYVNMIIKDFDDSMTPEQCLQAATKEINDEVDNEKFIFGAN